MVDGAGEGVSGERQAIKEVEISKSRVLALVNIGSAGSATHNHTSMPDDVDRTGHPCTILDGHRYLRRTWSRGIGIDLPNGLSQSPLAVIGAADELGGTRVREGHGGWAPVCAVGRGIVVVRRATGDIANAVPFVDGLGILDVLRPDRPGKLDDVAIDAEAIGGCI